MNNDRILKKSLFGGFKRTDVIDYVEKLQSENVSLAEELRQISAEAADAGDLKNEYDEAVAEIERLKAGAENDREIINTLRNENESLVAANAELSGRANKNEASCEEIQHELNAFKEKYALLEAEYNKLSGDKSNALIQDAMRYTDSLVSGARKTADKSLSEAHSAISSVSDEVFNASERVRNAQKDLEGSLTSIKSSVDILVETLSKCTSELSIGE